MIRTMEYFKMGSKKGAVVLELLSKKHMVLKDLSQCLEQNLKLKVT